MSQRISYEIRYEVEEMINTCILSAAYSVDELEHGDVLNITQLQLMTDSGQQL